MLVCSKTNPVCRQHTANHMLKGIAFIWLVKLENRSMSHFLNHVFIHQCSKWVIFSHAMHIIEAFNNLSHKFSNIRLQDRSFKDFWYFKVTSSSTSQCLNHVKCIAVSYDASNCTDLYSTLSPKSFFLLYKLASEPYSGACGAQHYPRVWFYPQLCEMLSQNHYLEMLAHGSVWVRCYSECVRVRVCLTNCYRTVIYIPFSLCVIWCSWLSSNLIWEHLIPRCLFPLCLISVLHKQGAGEI